MILLRYSRKYCESYLSNVTRYFYFVTEQYWTYNHAAELNSFSQSGNYWAYTKIGLWVMTRIGLRSVPSELAKISYEFPCTQVLQSVAHQTKISVVYKALCTYAA
jgi:hypothetical protein